MFREQLPWLGVCPLRLYTAVHGVQCLQGQATMVVELASKFRISDAWYSLAVHQQGWCVQTEPRLEHNIRRLSSKEPELKILVSSERVSTQKTYCKC